MNNKSRSLIMGRHVSNTNIQVTIYTWRICKYLK